MTVSAHLLVTLLLAAVFAQGPTGLAPARTEPRDEAAAVPDFASVRQRFESALRRRSVNEVLAFVDADTVISEQPLVTGRAAFRREWRLDAANSTFWEYTLKLLHGGSSISDDCGETKGACTISYPFWANGLPDALEDAAVMGHDVPVYKEPRESSAIVQRVSNEIVKLVRDPADVAVRYEPNWAHVMLRDRRDGFVRGSQIVRGTDPIFAFRRRAGGQWRLAWYLARD